MEDTYYHICFLLKPVIWSISCSFNLVYNQGKILFTVVYVPMTIIESGKFYMLAFLLSITLIWRLIIKNAWWYSLYLYICLLVSKCSHLSLSCNQINNHIISVKFLDYFFRTAFRLNYSRISYNSFTSLLPDSYVFNFVYYIFSYSFFTDLSFSSMILIAYWCFLLN